MKIHANIYIFAAKVIVFCSETAANLIDCITLKYYFLKDFYKKIF